MKILILFSLAAFLMLPVTYSAKTKKEKMASAYVMKEVYEFPISDVHIAPFMNSGHLADDNIITFLFKAVEKARVIACSTDDENTVLTWDEILRKLSPGVDNLGKPSSDSIIVNRFRLKFLVFYFYNNEDNIAFHKRLFAVAPLAEICRDDKLLSQNSLFLITNRDNQLHDLFINTMSSHIDYADMSYWNSMHGLNTKEFLKAKTFSLFKYASQLTGIDMVNAPDAPLRIEFPEKVKNVSLNIRHLPPYLKTPKFIEEYLFSISLYAIMETDLEELRNKYSVNQNLPLSFPGNLERFRSLADLILMATLDQTIDTYKFDTLKIFDEKISSQYLFQGVDTIQYRMNPYGNMLSDIVIYFNEAISTLLVLEPVFQGEAANPLAIAPGIQTHSALDGSSGKGFFKCWIPMNEALQKILGEYDIFLPNKPPMNFIQYFMNNMFKGEIIYSRLLDSQEWQKC